MFEIKRVVLTTILSAVVINSWAEDHYPLELLHHMGQDDDHRINEDISVFSYSNFIPGAYDVTLYINNHQVDQLKLNFELMQNAENIDVLTPCLSEDELNLYGVSLENLILDPKGCVNLNQIAYVKFKNKLDENKLFLTFPQSAFDLKKLQQLESKQWNDGIPAFFMNYSFSGFDSINNDTKQHDQSYFLNLQPGFNLGAWRYRQYLTWQKNQDGTEQWENFSKTLSRNINPLNSELILGDMYSDSWTFQSVKVRGVKLATDTAMRPYAASSYVPRVMGVAAAESTVTIRQNDQVIYKKAVPAGPFSIIDYSPMNSGGNLYVTVETMDGSQNTFIVPYANIANLEQKGQYRYSVIAGRYDSDNQRDGDFFGQFDLYRGLTDYITGYVGLQAADKYQAWSAGVGLNLGSFGAVSSNLIMSNAEVDHEQNYRGKSFKFDYSKTFTPTNTNISLVGYQYFDKQFLTFDEAMSSYSNDPESKFSILENNRIRQQLLASISQQFAERWGAVNMNMAYFNYADHQSGSTINMSYFNQYKRLSYSVNVNKYIKNQITGKDDWSVGLNLSIPLDWRNNRYWINSNSNYNHANSSTDTSISLGSSLGDQNQFNWSVYQNLANNGKDYSTGLSAHYNSAYGIFNGSYAYSSNSQNINYGASGSLLATQYGVAIGNRLSDANAVILVDDVAGIKVNNSSAKTNVFGVATYPGLTPYRKNNIVLDTQSFPDEIEIENNIASQLIPTRGAILLSDFRAQKGRKLFMTVANRDIPLGAIAQTTHGEKFIFSNFNQLYLIDNHTDESGVITVSWQQQGESQQCQIQYDLQQHAAINGLTLINANCE